MLDFSDLLVAVSLTVKTDSQFSGKVFIFIGKTQVTEAEKQFVGKLLGEIIFMAIQSHLI